MCPDLFNLESYNYELNPERIAQYPLEPRDSSKLMVLNRNQRSIEHKIFTEIIDLLNPGDLLILNSSKVFPARLFGYKQNGTKIEVMLLNELDNLHWKVMVHPGKRLKEVQSLHFSDRLTGSISLPDNEGFRTVKFEIEGDFFSEIEKIGHVPLPPYIGRSDLPEDRSMYQTVYADKIGSIAAPTAGFHFTEELLKRLESNGVRTATLLLHVGIGTFKPVQVNRIDQHKMHSEHCSISPDLVELYNDTRSAGNKVIAVGTTSLRALESFYTDQGLQSGSMWTDIFLYPGKAIRSVDGLVTNYHLPKSTLLMLVSSFAGYEFTRFAYQEALNNDYRFFSYGDAMLIL